MFNSTRKYLQSTRTGHILKVSSHYASRFDTSTIHLKENEDIVFPKRNEKESFLYVTLGRNCPLMGHIQREEPIIRLLPRRLHFSTHRKIGSIIHGRTGSSSPR